MQFLKYANYVGHTLPFSLATIIFFVDSVHLSQTLLLLFLFLGEIEPFLGHQFSMTTTTKRCY